MISQIQVAEYYGVAQFDSLLREMLLGGMALSLMSSSISL